ncbi:hypothetical protein ABEG18_12680 [Alsobacter sp. KACC 23698]|uniref:Uncharacterized protein n=1 Tax=Alsobacter sp. KACC 23698 TaxID=3149229 RepID=A0AAU7JN70_9HYPH
MPDALIQRADELLRLSSIELAHARTLREELRASRVVTAEAVRQLADVRRRLSAERVSQAAARASQSG